MSQVLKFNITCSATSTQEQGIAYRGRVLMELNAHMGEADPALKDKANIPDNETNDVMVSSPHVLY